MMLFSSVAQTNFVPKIRDDTYLLEKEKKLHTFGGKTNEKTSFVVPALIVQRPHFRLLDFTLNPQLMHPLVA